MDPDYNSLRFELMWSVAGLLSVQSVVDLTEHVSVEFATEKLEDMQLDEEFYEDTLVDGANPVYTKDEFLSLKELAEFLFQSWPASEKFSWSGTFGAIYLTRLRRHASHSLKAMLNGQQFEHPIIEYSKSLSRRDKEQIAWLHLFACINLDSERSSELFLRCLTSLVAFNIFTALCATPLVFFSEFSSLPYNDLTRTISRESDSSLFLLSSDIDFGETIQQAEFAKMQNLAADYLKDLKLLKLIGSS